MIVVVLCRPDLFNDKLPELNKLMQRLWLICFCLGTFLVALSLPAEARLSVGIAPTTALSRADQAALDRLGDQLGETAGTAVTFRRFEDGNVLADWLLRFMELDAAIVETDFIRRVPAGTLLRLADLHPQDRSQGRTLSLVVRRTDDADRVAALREAFMAIDASAQDRKLLARLNMEGVTAPGEALKKRVVKSAPPPKPEPAQPPPQKVEAPAAAQTVPPPPAPAPAQMSPPPSPAPVVATAPPSAPEKTTPEPPPMATKTEPQAPQLEPAAVEPPKTVAPASVDAPSATPAKDAETPPPSAKAEAPKVVVTPEKSTGNKRLVLFAALLILAAIVIKAILFALRWHLKRQQAAARAETPAAEPFTAPAPTRTVTPERVSVTAERVSLPIEPVPAPAPPPPAAAKVAEELPIEAGRLGPGKVPALLKRCADLPEPVVLRVRKDSCEKLVFFAGGKVAGALTQNTAESASAMRWKKLGSLLVREALISKEELNQGLELLDQQPGLRLGEALLKLGHIDLNRLRPALTRQAKVTLYSLILFPEGHYEIFSGDGQIPPEESVALDINELIKEASTHQAEWTTIRKTLPKLGMILDFTTTGRDKVANVSLSTQQEAILSLTNGQRTINDLCNESSLMDYEVYRFLYMMVKAGVLDKRAT